MFYPEPAYSQKGLLMRGCLLALAEGGPKFRSLGEAEQLNGTLVTKHFIPND